MSGNRPASRGSRPRAAARPGSRPGARPGGPRTRTPARAPAISAPPPRPRLTGRAAILVLVLAVLVVSYASSMRAYLEQRHHLESLRDSIAQSKVDIERLQKEKGRWDDPAFVRTQARLRFGWVLPGEIGLQVIDEDGKPLDHDDSLADPDQAAEDDQPLWWQSAWSTVEAAGNPQEETDVPDPATRIRAPKSPKQ